MWLCGVVWVCVCENRQRQRERESETECVLVRAHSMSCFQDLLPAGIISRVLLCRYTESCNEIEMRPVPTFFWLLLFKLVRKCLVSCLLATPEFPRHCPFITKTRLHYSLRPSSLTFNQKKGRSFAGNVCLHVSSTTCF